jgi:hypothetical protein
VLPAAAVADNSRAVMVMESSAFEALQNPQVVYKTSVDQDGAPVLYTDVVVIGKS